jgi:hypothetical protein
MFPRQSFAPPPPHDQNPDYDSILTLEGGSQTPSRIDQLLPSWKVRRGRRMTARSRNKTIVLRTMYSSNDKVTEKSQEVSKN